MKKKIIFIFLIISTLIITSIFIILNYNKKTKTEISKVQEDVTVKDEENLSDADIGKIEEPVSEPIIEDDSSNIINENIATVKEETKENDEVNTKSNTQSEKATIPPKTEVATTSSKPQTTTNTKNTKKNENKTNNNTTTTEKTTVKPEATPKVTQEQKNTQPVENKVVENKTVENKQTQSSQVETKSETTKSETVVRCTNNNNHGMDVGNSEQWFSTKNDAIQYYNNKIKYWGDLWESFQIDSNTYHKNCPSGYEVWSCMYCSKWTINFYY